MARYAVTIGEFDLEVQFQTDDAEAAKEAFSRLKRLFANEGQWVNGEIFVSLLDSAPNEFDTCLDEFRIVAEEQGWTVKDL